MVALDEDAEVSLRVKGRIKWFKPLKGYGFATLLETGQDAFIHKKDLPVGVLDLKKGQVVSFEVVQTHKANGLKGINVVLE